FSRSVGGIRATDRSVIGSGFFALMTLEEWVPTRTVEAVVHGIDVTDALGRPTVATPEGMALTAGVLDDLLARRRTGGGHPPARRRPPCCVPSGRSRWSCPARVACRSRRSARSRRSGAS